MFDAQYSTISLDDEERARVRRLQIACKAVKRCDGCGQTRPVHQFSTYGSARCQTCMDTPLETWWAGMKARRAAAT